MLRHISYLFFFFFFNDTATTEIYTLSLHDALPIYQQLGFLRSTGAQDLRPGLEVAHAASSTRSPYSRSEEHTSELQSQSNLVCRLLLEKKKKSNYQSIPSKNVLCEITQCTIALVSS